MLKGFTLATNMEKSESLLDQIIRRREQRVELVKTATERALAEEGEKQASVERDYEKFIRPIEERFIKQTLPTELSDLFEEFALKCCKVRAYKVTKTVTVDWPNSKSGLLAQYLSGNLGLPDSYTIAYQRTWNGGGLGGSTLSNSFGFSVCQNGDVYGYLDGLYKKKYENTQEGLNELAGVMVDCLQGKASMRVGGYSLAGSDISDGH